MRVIPAIDLLNGKCVRLTKGDYNTEKIYNENPLDAAKMFEDAGIKYLHVVDLDGARSKHIVNHKILSQICSKTNLQIDFGGGIKSNEDIKTAFDCGAAQITGGSIAVTDPQLFKEWIEKYGAEKIILGADSNNKKISTHGWQSTSELDVISFISDYSKHGIKYVICTDIIKDGMLEGTSNDLYTEIISATNVSLIASGGVSCMEDIEKLQQLGCEGVIIGKALYENKINLKELSTLC